LDCSFYDTFLLAVSPNDSYQLQQTILGSVPTTDTRVYIVNDQILNNLFVRYKERLYYIGYAYLSNAKVPLILRHFGDGVNGMGNDGYHTLVAAKTGGGKSTRIWLN
jgi:hypothetical protein